MPTFENIRIDLTEKELVERLFPYFSVVKVVQKAGTDGQTTFEFEFQVHNVRHHYRLEKIKKQIEESRIKEDLDIMRKTIQAQDPILGKELRDMDLGVRVMCIMKAHDIDSLGDLASCTRKEVLGFRMMGNTLIKELDELLQQHNLRFKEE